MRGVAARCSLAAAIVVMLCPGLSAAGVPPALALAATVGSSGMQADFSGELAGSLVYQQAAGASQALGILSGRLELRVDPVRSAAGFGSGPGGSSSGAPAWWAVKTVEPWLPVDLRGDGPAPEGSAAVTEAYAGFRFPAADVYLGRFALPLETARLVVPYTLTPPDDAGRRPGVDGVRADVYWDAGRLQLAAVREGNRWTPLVGWRQAFSGWEAAGYALARGRGVDAGIGASGLLGSTVVYGEAWRAAGEEGLRGSVGATGYWGDAVWTAELARARFPTTLAPGPVSPPVLLVAAQLAYAPAAGWTLAAGGAVALEELPFSYSPPSAPGGAGPGSAGPGGAGPGGSGGASRRAYQVGVTVTNELVPGEVELELGLRRWTPPAHPGAGAAGTTATAGLRWFF